MEVSGNGESRDLSTRGAGDLLCGPLKRSVSQPAKDEVGCPPTTMRTQHGPWERIPRIPEAGVLLHS